MLTNAYGRCLVRRRCVAMANCRPMKSATTVTAMGTAATVLAVSNSQPHQHGTRSLTCTRRRTTARVCSKKTDHMALGKRMCAAKQSTTRRPAQIYFTTGVNYTKVRGRITAYSLGMWQSFLKTPISVLGEVVKYRGKATINDRYVDGISVTRWSPAERKREHVFTLAVGVSRKVAIDCDKPNLDLLSPTCAMPMSTYSSNCICHGGGTSVAAKPAYDPAHLIPSFVGSSWYCGSSNDGTAGNSWSDHEMFIEPSTCVNTKLGDMALWERLACSPGEWVSTDLPPSTAPLEVRLLMSQDTFYVRTHTDMHVWILVHRRKGTRACQENIGITSLKLSVFGIKHDLPRRVRSCLSERLAPYNIMADTTRHRPQQLFEPPLAFLLVDEGGARVQEGAYLLSVDWLHPEVADLNSWSLAGSLTRSVSGLAGFDEVRVLGLYNVTYSPVFRVELPPHTARVGEYSLTAP